MTLYIRNFVSSSVNLLNQPLFKEGIKNGAGIATALLGAVAAHDLYKWATGQRKITTEKDTGINKSLNPLPHTIHKMIMFSSKISLILSAAVSRPGVLVISSLVGRVFTTAQLDKVFGLNTIFAINPWHPRHVISIVAVALATPALIESAYRIYQNTRQYKTDANSTAWLTDAKVKATTLFNFITSRPTLHIGNQLGRFLITRTV